MIKDIIVNLELRIARDPAREFAIAIAETFDTHVAGVAFAYAPEFPGYVILEIPPQVVAQMIAQSEKAAVDAIERFDAAARRSLVSAEHRLLKTIGAEAPAILSTLARRFDLSVFMQSEPASVDNDDMIETSLFNSGRPVIVVPYIQTYIQKDGLRLDRVVCCWDGSRAGHQRCPAAADQGDGGRSADRAEQKDKERSERTSWRRNGEASRAPRHQG